MSNFFYDFMRNMFAQVESKDRTKSGKQIHHANPSRIPANVLAGCVQELVIVPGSDHAASTREGKPVFAVNKHGQRYRVTDQYGITRKQWKKLVADEKRRAAGRFVGVFGFPSKAAA